MMVDELPRALPWRYLIPEGTSEVSWRSLINEKIELVTVYAKTLFPEEPPSLDSIHEICTPELFTAMTMRVIEVYRRCIYQEIRTVLENRPVQSNPVQTVRLHFSLQRLRTFVGHRSEFLLKDPVISTILKNVFAKLINESTPPIWSFLQADLERELSILAEMDLEKHDFVPQPQRNLIDLPLVLAKKCKKSIPLSPVIPLFFEWVEFYKQWGFFDKSENMERMLKVAKKLADFQIKQYQKKQIFLSLN